jgi:hypothetical protein
VIGPRRGASSGSYISISREHTLAVVFPGNTKQCQQR